MKTMIKTILAGTFVFAAFFAVGTLVHAEEGYEDYSEIYEAGVSGLWNHYPVYGNDTDLNGEEIVPVVRTMGAVQITRTSAVLQVFYDSNGSNYNNMTDLPQLYVQYGTTTSMTSMTPVMAQGRGSRVLSFRLSNLDEDTTYYYRAVFMHHGETVQGSRLSFRTLEEGESQIGVSVTDSSNTLFGGNTVTTYTTNTNTNNSSQTSSNTSLSSQTSHTTNTSSTSSGSQNQVAGISQSSASGVVTGSAANVSLRITNDESEFKEGDKVTFRVTISNTGTMSARSGRLVISIPSEFDFLKSSDGSFDEGDNELTVRLSTLAAGSSKTITVDARVSDLKDDDSVTTRAVLTFTKSGISYTVRASDTDDIEASAGNVLGASVFGAGFFPQTLAGWVLLIIIITALIFVIRRYSKGDTK